MKKKVTTSRVRLVLKKSTLRVLTRDALVHAVGGIENDDSEAKTDCMTEP